MALDHEDQWDGIRQDTDKSDSQHAAGSAEAASVHSASVHQDPFDIADLIDGMDDIAAMQPAQFVTDTPFVNDDSSAGSDNTGTSSTDSSNTDVSSTGDVVSPDNGTVDARQLSPALLQDSGSPQPERESTMEPVAEERERETAAVEETEKTSAAEEPQGTESKEDQTAEDSTPAHPARPSLARRLWKRPVCHTWWHKVLWELVHVAVFAGLVLYSLWILQSSVYPDAPKTRDPQQNSAALFFHTLFDRGIIQRAIDNGWDVFTTIPVGVAWLDVALLAAFFAFFIVAINRFWIAAWVFLTVSVVYSVANSIKMEERNSIIIPSDLNFLSSGDGGKLMSFVPDSYQSLIGSSIRQLALLAVLMIVLNHFDCRRSFISPTKHRRIAATVRVALCCVYVLGTAWFASSMLVTGTVGQKIDAWFNDQPALFDSRTDAQVNGAAVAFVHLLDNKVMDEPANYSRQTMEDLASRYAAQADAINATRTENMTDSTVIMILSESFTDPTRVPDTQWNEDPVPFLHQLQQQTTSGLMLSSGYGGGTANMEYMSLTGMALPNFAAGLSTPYQQLVPKEKWTPSFNQLWQQGDSIGIHPFFSSMYGRKAVYKKFGFRSLRTVDNKEDSFTTTLDMIDRNPYVSDAATYNSVMAELQDHQSPEFISVMTMQNHLPYTDWYDNNQFHATNAVTGGDFLEDEESSVNTYAKGVNYTDQALQNFLAQLDQLDRPVTVIWYGDHYPSVFVTANSDPANALTLHETDYFIWSNAASASAGVKLSDEDAAYSSSNFFMAQAAEHMNAKVSPYLVFLTRMHQQIAAMGLQIDATSTSGAEYLDAQGNPIDEADLTDEQRQLLDDYKLVQYDVTAGKGYLRDTGFMDVPASDENGV